MGIQREKRNQSYDCLLIHLHALYICIFYVCMYYIYICHFNLLLTNHSQLCICYCNEI